VISQHGLHVLIGDEPMSSDERQHPTLTLLHHQQPNPNRPTVTPAHKSARSVFTPRDDQDICLEMKATPAPDRGRLLNQKACANRDLATMSSRARWVRIA
jgi:hypothetical protein